MHFQATAGDFSDLPVELDSRLRAALGSRGIRRLYSHQSQAFSRAQDGRNLVIVTPTASGKTLCYNLPVLNSLLQTPWQRALYLFPTKALAQDQMAELQQLLEGVHARTEEGGARLGVHTYDGDTPGDVRRRIRGEASIVLTNPDMLHTGILPHHPKWAHFLQNLRWVVVDELHTYRGIFGSHLANVFRRLKRIARFYRTNIQFVCASATIANPSELASHLLGEEVELIDQNGAPRSSKELIFYNPPLVNPDLGLRRSALSSARRFAERLLREQVQTLVFASSRVNVEVLLSYLQKALHHHPGEKDKVRGYRGGYLPKTRREIERQLRQKEILGVVSTNALELGIDIGSLEACVLAGYPGSISSTWQQVGRAGRRNGRSAAILVARNLPLDQFIVRHPEYFLGRSPEHGLIHADNLQILVSHIKCAAFELPFQRGEVFGEENLEEILDFLAEQGTLCRNGDRWNWADEAFPADSVSLRHLAEENFVVLDSGEGNRSIAEVDFDSAPELIHQEAIYMCEGRQYFVDRLDYPGRKAYTRQVKVDYYTEAITYSALRVLRCEEVRSEPLLQAAHGEVHLTKKFPGFKKIKFYTGENLGYGKIDLPVHELHTTAYWFTAPEEKLADCGFRRDQIILGFLGIGYSMQHIATVILMCDLQDIGRSVGDRSAGWFVQPGQGSLGFYSSAGEDAGKDPEAFDSFNPTLFLYDNYPGGIGFSEKLYESHSLLLSETSQLVQACPCTRGCPSCVGPAVDNGGDTKTLTLDLLRFFLSR